MLAIIWASTLLFCLIASLLNFFNLKFKAGSYSLSTKNSNDYLYLFFTSIIFFVIFILITSNRTGPDIINYFNSYQYKHNIWGREIFYNSLKGYFFIRGYTFYEFRAIITFIAGAIVYYSFLKLKIDLYLFSVLYMPMMLFIDSMQFRNSVSMCILIFSIYILINKKNLFSKSLFILLVVIAAQIHTVFIFYLSLIFYDSKYEKDIKKWVSIGVFLLIMITLANGNKPPFVEKILSLVLNDNDDRLTRYLTRGNFGFVIPTLLHSFSIILIRIMSQNKAYDLKDFKVRNLNKLVKWSNTISLIFIPLTMMNMNFYRMLRNSFYLSIILIISMIRTSEFSKQKRFFIILILILLTVFWLFFEAYYNSTSLWKHVFEGELFWK